jgi:hypothetical protein
MDNLERLTLAEMKEFVANNRGVPCQAVEREAAYGFIERVLRQQSHWQPKGVTGGVTTVDTSSGGPLTPQPITGAATVTIGGQPATVTFHGEAPVWSPG